MQSNSSASYQGPQMVAKEPIGPSGLVTTPTPNQMGQHQMSGGVLLQQRPVGMGGNMGMQPQQQQQQPRLQQPQMMGQQMHMVQFDQQPKPQMGRVLSAPLGQPMQMVPPTPPIGYQSSQFYSNQGFSGSPAAQGATR